MRSGVRGTIRAATVPAMVQTPTAHRREPTAEEVTISETYVMKPRTDAQGVIMDSFKAKHLGYEDLLWAILNTKEFLFNH